MYMNIDVDDRLFKDYLERKGVTSGTIKKYSTIVRRFINEKGDYENPESYYEFLTKYTQRQPMVDYSKVAKEQKRFLMSNYIYALKAFVNYKIQDKELRAKIIEAFPKPKNNPRRNNSRISLNYEMFPKLVSRIKHQKHRIIASIQAMTGIRAGDVFRIRPQDIVLEEYKKEKPLKINVLGKGEKQHTVFIYDEDLVKEILDFREKNNYGYGYLFLQDKFDKGITKAVKRVNKALSKVDKIKLISVEIENFPAGSELNIRDLFPNKPLDEIRDLIEPLVLEGKIKYLFENDGVIIDFDNFYMFNYNNYWADLKQATVSMGMPYNGVATHDLRRAYCRYVFIKTGKDLELTRKLMNHSRLDTTLRYLETSGLSRIDADKEMQTNMFSGL